jgi:hypothetical protein
MREPDLSTGIAGTQTNQNEIKSGVGMVSGTHQCLVLFGVAGSQG